MEQLMCVRCGRTNVRLMAIRSDEPQKKRKKGKLLGYLCKICGGR